MAVGVPGTPLSPPSALKVILSPLFLEGQGAPKNLSSPLLVVGLRLERQGTHRRADGRRQPGCTRAPHLPAPDRPVPSPGVSPRSHDVPSVGCGGLGSVPSNRAWLLTGTGIVDVFLLNKKKKIPLTVPCMCSHSSVAMAMHTAGRKFYCGLDTNTEMFFLKGLAYKPFLLG